MERLSQPSPRRGVGVSIVRLSELPSRSALPRRPGKVVRLVTTHDNSVLQRCIERVVESGHVIEHASADTDPAIVARRSSGKMLHVKFHSESTVGIDAVHQLRGQMEESGVSRTWLMSTGGPTSLARKEALSDARIEFLTFDQLATSAKARGATTSPSRTAGKHELDDLVERFRVSPRSPAEERRSRTRPRGDFVDDKTLLPRRLVPIDRTHLGFYEGAYYPRSPTHAFRRSLDRADCPATVASVLLGSASG